MTYAEFSAANVHDWKTQHGYLVWGVIVVPKWGNDVTTGASRLNMEPDEFFQKVCALGVIELAKQTAIDWTRVYGTPLGVKFGDGADIVATILAAVVAGFVPAMAPLFAIIEPVIAAILRAMLAQMQKAAAANPVGFGATIQQFALEAA